MPVRDLLSAASTQGAAPSDPYFYDVSLLLNGDGTNGAQNNTFLDSSSNAFTITRNGNTTQGSFSPYGSLWSNYVSGTYSSGNTGPYIKGGTSVSLSGDFTYEGWFNISSFSNFNYLFNLGDDSTSSGMTFYIVNSTTFRIYHSNTTVVNYTVSALSTNTWYHIAFVRNSGVITLYLNGVSQGTYSNSDALSGNPYLFAEFFAGQYYGGFSGYASNVRLTNNAVYTTTFTPSTTPLTAISGTQFLTCQSNRFIDNSSNNATITVGGSPSVQRFSPFNPTAPYSTTTIGGSCYVNGSNQTDYLQLTNTLNVSSTFTLEGWFYATSLSFPTYSQGAIVSTNKSSAGGANGVGLSLYNDGGLHFFVGNGNQTIANTTVTINQWYHFAFVYNGSTVYAYLDGVQVGNTTTSIANVSQYTTIGAGVAGVSWNASIWYTGYVSDIRATNTQVYTGSTYTVPTAPLTSISGTNFLTNMTNAGIPDLAMQNDLQTVGSAQVSTSVVKYGTGSLSFSGSGAYLPTASNPAIAFGTGDFTIEFWMNSNDVSTAQKGPFQTSTTTGGLAPSYSTGILMFEGANGSGGNLAGGLCACVLGTFIGSSTPVLTTGTWYHVALVRSSGTVTLYVNGVSNGSATVTGNITASNLVVGGYYSTSYLYNGYLDDFRITNGYARYTTNFTPPTAALPTY